MTRALREIAATVPDMPPASFEDDRSILSSSLVALPERAPIQGDDGDDEEVFTSRGQRPLAAGPTARSARLVRRKDEAAYEEYRTARLILERYDEMTKAIETGAPYRGVLD